LTDYKKHSLYWQLSWSDGVNTPVLAPQRYTAVRTTAIALLIALLAIGALGMFAIWNARSYLESASKAELGQLKMESLSYYYDAMQDAESGQRGYLITSKRSYLEPYYAASEVVNARLGIVKGLFKDDPKAQADMQLLEAMTKQKFQEMKYTIQVHDTLGADAARAAVNNDVGKMTMEDIRVAVLALQALERGALGMHSSDAYLRLNRWTLLGAAFTIITMLLLIVAAVEIIREVRLRNKLEEQLRELAGTDPLTGLPNRRALHDLIGYNLTQARRSHRSFAVMYLDLDGFKALNDRWGHAAGDRILCEVGSILKDTVREGDTVARVGGDEFVILIPEINVGGEAAMLASRILDALRPVQDAMAQDKTLGASIGIALFPEDGATAEGLIQSADKALYRAKEAGKHRYHFFNDFYTTNTTTKFRPNLREDLEYALERNELSVVYQPIIDLINNRLVSMEALMRWQHPKLGDVAPEDFIPVAEASGLIVPLGQWVLSQACQQVKQWRTQGWHELRMNVNVSAQQWRSSELSRMVQNALMDHQLPHNALMLEISERGLTQEPSLDELKRLKGSGVQLVLDDFGTGYSSLNYLKRFPIDLIKIDSLFVKGLPQDETDAAVVSAVIALAKRLGFSVIAEGVETAAQCEFLRKQGCEYAQGFYFSKPLNAEDMTRQMRANMQASAYIQQIVDTTLRT
jgi:diguanylate cyclase (GGDEF)-like protein